MSPMEALLPDLDFTIDQTRLHSDHGEVDPEWTDVCLNVVEGSRVVDITRVRDLFSQHADAVDSLYTVYAVVDLIRCHDKVDQRVTGLQAELIAFGVLIAVIATILVVSLCCLSAGLAHKLENLSLDANGSESIAPGGGRPTPLQQPTPTPTIHSIAYSAGCASSAYHHPGGYHVTHPSHTLLLRRGFQMLPMCN